MITRPMLAANTKDVNLIRFPVLASPKLDGIRCLKVDGKAVSRRFKPIPNNYIRNFIEGFCPEGVDGELTVKRANFNDIQSYVMRRNGEPDFEYNVFDLCTDGEENSPFGDRLNTLRTIDVKYGLPIGVKILPQHVIGNLQSLLSIENYYLAYGYEGLILRHPASPYKCGRSTWKEQYMLKLKRFSDAEAVVVDLEEGKHNDNPKAISELGLTERSSRKGGMIPNGTLGKFVCHMLDDPPTKLFRIGTGEGLTQSLRQKIWDNPNQYIGKIIRFKYQSHGMKELPRMPIFTGFRDERDID